MFDRLNFDDTIVAISTPIGIGGIGIVRLSGKDAIKIVDRIFVAKTGKRLASIKSHRIIYGKIVDLSNSVLDEVLVTVMRAPKTYTKEDIVEINCHGGLVVTKAILDLVVSLGGRVACKGEFTMRAFLNARIDLVQAEATLDLIEAQTNRSLNQSLCQLSGELSKKIGSFSKIAFELLINLEAKINFPDEGDVKSRIKDDFPEKINSLINELSRLMETFQTGRLIKEGINVVICGRTNVGKSSLLNELVSCDRSIVSSIPGTTRDTIDELVNLDGFLMRITDTAGIIEAKDEIEKEALRRSKKAIKDADVILLMVDASQGLNKEDQILITTLKNRNIILIINKIDLPRKIELSNVGIKNKVFISVLKKRNIGELKKLIVDSAWNDKLNSSLEFVLTNSRQKEALNNALNYLIAAQKSFNKEFSFEFIAEDIKKGIAELDSITGRHTTDAMLESIFSRFCIGK